MLPTHVLEAACQQACPSRQEEERVRQAAEQAVSILTRRLPQSVTPFLGGSIAKGTWLKGVKDIDIFLIHETPEVLSEMQKAYPSLLKEVFGKVRILKGSREYYQADHAGFTLELVPILHIQHPREAVNTTDVSPLHVAFVKQHVKQPREARLFKYWLRQKQLYGAETYRHGVSGYAAELLTIIFKRFEDILAWLARQDIPLKPPTPWEDALGEREEPFLLADPVMPWRNATAAVSRENAERLVRFARECMEQPEDCFKAYEWPYQPPYVEVSLTAREYVTDDITGARLEKAYRRLRRLLEPFHVVDAFFSYEGGRTARALFKLGTLRLPPVEERLGPPVTLREAAERFKRMHAGEEIIERDGRLILIRKRELREPCDYIRLLRVEGVDGECRIIS